MKKFYLLGLLAICISTTAFSQRTIHVPTDYSSIQAALSNASSNDTVLVQTGVYEENIIWPETNGIKLLSAGDSTNTIIDGTESDRVINIIHAAIDTNTVIKGFRIRNGLTSQKGGGIQITNGSVKLHSVLIENCEAQEMAGGIYSEGNLVLINSAILSNQSDYIGGIRCQADVCRLHNVMVANNNSTGDNRNIINAGGVSITSPDYSISNCTFKNNRSESYGGGASVDGNGSVTGSEFTENSAKYHYGAALSVKGTSVVDDVNVHNNGNSISGTLFFMQGNIILKNSVVKDNESIGVRVEYYGEFTIKNTEFSGQKTAIKTGRDNNTGKLIVDSCTISRDQDEMPSEGNFGASEGISLTKYAGIIELSNSTIKGFTHGIFGNHADNSINIHKSIFTANENGINNKSINTTIDSTIFSINDVAILNQAQGMLQVNESDFLNNNFGINSLNDGNVLNAENNYWGDDSGPYNDINHPSGKGDSITVYVDASPFRTTKVFGDYRAPIFLKSLENNKDQSITLKWEDDNRSDIDHIDIYYKCVDSLQWSKKTVPNDDQIDTLQNLIPYVTYEVKVKSVDLSGNESEDSNTLLAYTDDDRTSFFVPADFATIQRALNCCSPNDTVFVSPGTYKESLTWPNVADVHLIGDSIKPNTTIIDGEQKNRCISIVGNSIISASINGFKLINGYDPEKGGGIFIEAYYIVNLSNCILSNNKSKIGAAICSYDNSSNGIININRLLIHSNESEQSGAAMYCLRDDVNINSSTIANNTSLNSDASKSGNGGVFASGTVKINNSIVWNHGSPNMINYTGYNMYGATIQVNYSCLKYGDTFNNGAVTGNTSHNNGIIIDPLFADTLSHDYTLQSNSPCIDSGNPDMISDLCSRIDMGYWESPTGNRINHSETSISICNGDSLLWKGKYYSEEGQYFYEKESDLSCDSIYELNLSVNPTYLIEEKKSICDGDSLLWQNTYYSIAGTYSVELTTDLGCDSIRQLELVVNPVFEQTEERQICQGDSLLWRNSYYKQSGTYADQLSSSTGCDSTYYLNLVVKPTYHETIEASICQGENYMLGSQTLTESGEYTEVFESDLQCDSIVTLQLNVHPIYQENIEATICQGDEYLFGSQILSEAGEYTETFLSQHNCDSVVNLNLKVNPTYQSQLEASICQGESYIFGSQTLTQVGEYTEVLQSINGCDSIVILNLTVNAEYHEQEDVKICQGEAYVWGTQTLTESGEYTEVFKSVHNCDSIVTLRLEVGHAHNTETEVEICQGDTYVFGTQNLSEAGVYTEVFKSAHNCDSTVILHLAVKPIYLEELEATICQGDEYILGTQTLTQTGVYTEVFQSVHACDSTVILRLNVIPAYHEEAEINICQGEEYILGSQTLTESGEYTEVFQTHSGCDSTKTVILTVQSVDTRVEQDGSTLKAVASDATYQWVKCDDEFSEIESETNASFTPVEDGDYAVIVNQNECSDRSDCYSIIITSVFDEFKKDWNIYPNPVKQNLHINLDRAYADIQVNVYNSSGQVVMSKQSHTSKQLMLEVNDLANGLYILKIDADNKHATYKFIKK
ncbi:T9SS type A sorting domain-containing protein [Marinifilum caeruleilacunae]|uniref:T9SS type A sorting domain-containing protein n=1 Tax=Marinifilum caeruleilacunae TaxID=2499076 RepID=A0ABX1WR25_9BACT|nr:T9SS type A sorting domain-containing protein [Marinifilum caeruleilacunae]NOU58518.1 T9SS type A sorting domain-containing protein [Marinifilum caeruleilacunae]